MRIHRLEIQAFGPFAERQVIDFDDVGAQGLFLLNGPTGAGKTSVLDAICFALYGGVPGARQQAKRLRSDHAEPAAAPEVVLEFSSGCRRLEVARSPQWERPAKRAGGRATVTEQARTLLRELVGGQWVEKSARNDEASAEIQALLGMNKEQFTRVVMLPQGDFAAFLRADATERAVLLQKLFGTDRFERVEEQLRQEAAAAEAKLAAEQQELDHILRRADDEMLRHRSDLQADDGAQGDEAAGEGIEPGEAGEGAEAAPEKDTDPVERIAAAEERLRTRLKQAEEDLAGGEASVAEADAACTALHTRRERGLERSRLARDLERHRQEDAALEPVRAQLQAHRHACAVAGVLDAWQGASDAAAQAEDAAADAVAALVGRLHQPPVAAAALPADRQALPEALTELDYSLAEDLAAARAGLAEEERAAQLAAEAALAADQAAEHSRGAEAAAAERARLRVELDAVEADLERLKDAGAVLQGLRRDLAEAEARRRAVTAFREAAAASASAAAVAADLRGRYQDLRGQWQDAVARRLEQAAADLAAGLVPGSSCPVCGALEHPAPAPPPADGEAVDREAEEQLRDRVAAAEEDWEAARRQAEALALQQEGLRAQGGDGDAAEAAGRVQALQQAIRQAEAEAEALAAGEQRREQLLARQQAQAGAEQDARVAEAAARTRSAEAQQRAAELAARTAELRGGFETLAGRVAVLTELRRLVEAARTALSRAEARRARSVEAEAALAGALADTEFADAGEVRGALLADALAGQLQARIDEHEEQGRRLALREEALAGQEDDGGRPLPSEEDIAAAEAGLESLRQRRREADLLVQRLRDSADVLAGYAVQARAVSARVDPMAARCELLRGVADAARGAGENRYRMALSTYVLAARLEQVAAAATERLAAMTGGRYALVHSDARSGNRRAGLGLHVIDGWTGQTRDTGTLSGGEGFMASLSLALGLADVVQQEAGGVSIETLFVDEGFGSLDDQSLEQVMDALEGLRDGGRIVGLVSHVAEMKQRVTSQLQIVKGRRGSHIVTRLAGGDIG